VLLLEGLVGDFVFFLGRSPGLLVLAALLFPLVFVFDFEVVVFFLAGLLLVAVEVEGIFRNYKFK